MYQLQPPPVTQPPQVQIQPQQAMPYLIPLSPQQSNSSHTIGHNRADLRELANKLGIKNGGHPPNWAEPRHKKAKNNHASCSVSTNGNGKRNNRQLGIKLAQRGFKFSEQQRTRLSEAFALNRYPRPDDMEIIAYEINAKKDQVKNWFHDQRRKYKKEEARAAKTTSKKGTLSAQQRRKLEEFFEKNFHPYPGDSRRLVNEFELGDDHVQFRYEEESMRYECVDQGAKVVRSRGFKFSEEQRIRLKNYFDENKYPNPNDMEQLAYELSVKREQIKNWFHDQRRKFKRENSIR